MKVARKPENQCEGCADRDRLIARLAAHADELRAQIDGIIKAINVNALRLVRKAK